MADFKIKATNSSSCPLLCSVIIIQGQADPTSPSPFSNTDNISYVTWKIGGKLEWNIVKNADTQNAVAIFQMYDSYKNPMTTIVANLNTSKDCTIPISWDSGGVFTVKGQGTEDIIIGEPVEPVYNIQVTQP